MRDRGSSPLIRSVLFLSLVAGPPPLGAVLAMAASPGPETQPRRVERIEVEGCSLVDRADVEARIRARVGDPYDREQVEATVDDMCRRLLANPIIEDYTFVLADEA